MNKLPLAKTKNLVMQNLETEVLIYNLRTNKVYCLNETLAIVFEACNGETEFAELIYRRNLPEDLINLSLQELQKANLLESKSTNYLGKTSRREIIRRIGLTTVFALPLMTSLVAPSSAQAQSTVCFNQPCTFDNNLQSDCCNNSFRCSNSMTPNFCQLCFQSGSRFAFAEPFADDKFCNSQPSKNLCCNEGFATGDGSWCYCP